MVDGWWLFVDGYLLVVICCLLIVAYDICQGEAFGE
jgi:hypothetical protein